MKSIMNLRHTLSRSMLQRERNSQNWTTEQGFGFLQRIPDLFFATKVQKVHLYVVTIEVQLLLNRCKLSLPEDQNKVGKQTFSSLSPKYAIVKKIIEQDWDYVISLKGN